MASTQVGNQGQVFAKLSNETVKEVFCERYFNFSGAPGAFPPAIPAQGSTPFADFGTKGAVLYDGLNLQNAPISWILAWDAPKISPGAQLKVIVMCGTKSDMNNVTEQQILEALEKGVNEASASDADSQAFVIAKITPGPTDGPAYLTSTFALVV